MPATRPPTATELLQDAGVLRALDQVDAMKSAKPILGRPEELDYAAARTRSDDCKRHWMPTPHARLLANNVSEHREGRLRTPQREGTRRPRETSSRPVWKEPLSPLRQNSLRPLTLWCFATAQEGCRWTWNWTCGRR